MPLNVIAELDIYLKKLDHEYYICKRFNLISCSQLLCET